MKQIEELNLPPNPTKMTDSRSEKYIQKFGRTCWEVDALNPRTLTEIIETNIQKIIDMDLYDATIDEENEGIEELKTIIKNR